LESTGFTALRALMYKYASELIDYPYDEDVEKLPSRLREFVELLKQLERYSEVFAELAERTEKAANTLLRELEKLGRDMFQAEYVATFELGMKGPKCPPYESEYVKPEKPSKVFIEPPATLRGNVDQMMLKNLESKMDIISSVSLFYEKYGVKAKDMIPDHIVAELEFMHYLATKECEALSRSNVEEAMKLREAQREFLENHLARWVGSLAKCVEDKGSLKGYAELLRVIEQMIQKDLKLLKENVRRTKLS